MKISKSLAKIELNTVKVGKDFLNFTKHTSSLFRYVCIVGHFSSVY